MDFHRKNGKNPALFSTLAKDKEGFTPEFASNSTSADSCCEVGDLLKVLQRELSLKDWGILEARYFHEHKVEAIADDMGLKKDAVYKRLQSARIKAEAVLRRHGLLCEAESA